MQEDPVVFLEKMAAAFTNNPPAMVTGGWGGRTTQSGGQHISVIRYFSKPILPCRLTPEEKHEMKLLQAEAIGRERQRLNSPYKQQRSQQQTRGVHSSMPSISPRSMEDLSTTPTRASVAAGRRAKFGVRALEIGDGNTNNNNNNNSNNDGHGNANVSMHSATSTAPTIAPASALPAAAVWAASEHVGFESSNLNGSSDVQPATPGSASRRIRLRTALEQPERPSTAGPPLSPSHRPVKMQYPAASSELHQMPLPPRDISATATRRPKRSAAESAALASKGMECLPAVIKGYITRQLMQTDKVKNLIRTIHDTNGIILEFAHEGVGTLTYTDRGFLRRAQSQLASAKSELLSLFRAGSGGERAKVMAQHREQETEKMFRSSIETYDGVDASQQQQQGGEGARLLSEATRRQILRRNMGKDLGIVGVTAPALVTAPQQSSSSPIVSRRVIGGASSTATASSVVHRSAPEMSSPKHTDFLRRKTGSSASGKHADAPGGPGGSSTNSPSTTRKGPKKAAFNNISSSGSGDALLAPSMLPQVAVTQSADQIPLRSGTTPTAANGGGAVSAEVGDGKSGRRHTYTLEEPPELRDNGALQGNDSVFMG
eukprot:gene152-32866_t